MKKVPGTFNREARLWSYDEIEDRAYLSATLVARSLDLSNMLDTMSHCLSPSHRPTAEWLKALGKRIASEATEAGGKPPCQIPSREFAHRIEGLCEIARKLLRVEYLACEERARLAQHLERVWHLAYELNGFPT